MLVYWSDFVGAGTTLSPLRDRAGVGNRGGIRDMRVNSAQLTGRCLVGSSVTLPTPTGVTFLLDWPADRDTLVPNGVINFLNTQLGLSIPTQTYTWKQLLRRLFLAGGDGEGRWGTLRGELRLRFGSAGNIDLSAA